MPFGQALKNLGQLGSWAAQGAGRGFWGTAMGRYGRTAAGALYGGLAGGMYGAMSNNTSVLSGMAMGAGLGAGGARYGGAGFRTAGLANRMGIGNRGLIGQTSMLAKSFGRGAFRQGARDYRGARLMANNIGTRIQGLGVGLGGMRGP